MSKKAKIVRTSLHLPVTFIKALDIIRNEKRIYKSHQIEMGLLKFFEEHRALLESKGLHLWKGKL